MKNPIRGGNIHRHGDGCGESRMKFKNLFFEPYVGKNFGTSLLGKRVLVVGASHYCTYFHQEIGCGERCGHYDAGSCRDFTNDVMECYFNRANGDEGWMHTYSKFFNTFFECMPTDEVRRGLIETIAFMNYLQGVEGHDANEKNTTLFVDKRNFNALLDVIDDLEVEVIITWGNRVWDAFWSHQSEFETFKSNNGTDVKFDTLKLSDGTDARDVFAITVKGRRVIVVGLYHPSSTSLYKNDPQALYRLAGINILK